MEGSLVKDNPLLLPLNKEKTAYDGFITVQERHFRLRILLQTDQQLKKAKFYCSWQLKHFLCGYEHIVKQRLQQSADLVSFILELKTVLEMELKSRPKRSNIAAPKYYSQLITEIESLGWDKLLFIDSEFKMLRLKAEDSSGRQHILTLKLKPKHPTKAPECLADLPVPLAIAWTSQETMSPSKLKWIPDIQRCFLSASCLELIMDFRAECAICYSYCLKAAIPDQVCNDPRCGQSFHQTCLYEWLRALPSSRQSFNIVFGECPYCSKPITVKMVM